MWLARAADWKDWEDEHGGHVRLRGRIRIDNERLWEDIEKMGLGMVAEVDGDDGAQVLVWLR
jgi:hypothetical protein